MYEATKTNDKFLADLEMRLCPLEMRWDWTPGGVEVPVLLVPVTDTIQVQIVSPLGQFFLVGDDNWSVGIFDRDTMEYELVEALPRLTHLDEVARTVLYASAISLQKVMGSEG